MDKLNIISIYKFIALIAGSIFLYQAILSFLHYRIHKNSTAISFIGLCLCTSFFSILIALKIDGLFNISNFAYSTLTAGVGILSGWFYYSVISKYLDFHHWSMTMAQYGYGITGALCILDFFIIPIFGKGLFYTQTDVVPHMMLKIFMGNTWAIQGPLFIGLPLVTIVAVIANFNLLYYLFKVTLLQSLAQ